MRMLPLALFALFAPLPALAQQLGDANSPVLPETPSGYGDPAAVVCRAPQRIPGSDAMGPKVCMHNEIWLRLTLTGKELSADGKSVFMRTAMRQPTGNGNPDTVTCRRPAQLTASRVRSGPEVCLTNDYWKKLAEENLAVDPNGLLVSTLPTGPTNGPDGFPTVSVHQSPAL